MAGKHRGGAVMKDALGGCGPELRGPWPLRVGTWLAWGWGFLEERSFVGSSLLRKPPCVGYLLGVRC